VKDTLIPDVPLPTPCNLLIIIEPDKPPEKINGLYMPPSADTQRTSTGTVLASASSLCKAGDRISYIRFYPMNIDGKDFWFVNEKDIFAICGPKPPVVSAANPGKVLLN
jgi:hypothetical protein